MLYSKYYLVIRLQSSRPRPIQLKNGSRNPEIVGNTKMPDQLRHDDEVFFKLFATPSKKASRGWRYGSIRVEPGNHT